MWHSCGKFSFRELFARSDPRVFTVFRKFSRMVRACGRSHMIPQKTRVVFQTRIRFAGATPRKSYLICHFILPRRIGNERFQKIEKYGRRCYGHYLRVKSETDLNSDVACWIQQAYDAARGAFD
jgi:Domain of unknown function (DUF5655)